VHDSGSRRTWKLDLLLGMRAERLDLDRRELMLADGGSLGISTAS
jgi:hypothetical protein